MEMQKKEPVHEFVLEAITFSIWENRTANHDTWFNVTATRSYQVEGQRKKTSSYRRDDLPIVAQGLHIAYAWIWSRQMVVNEAYES